jgi:DNA-binding protein H-NS
MMSTLQQLLAEKEALEKKIAEARRQESAQALSQVRALVAQFDLKPSDIFPAEKRRSGAASVSVKPKYRDPATGKTWTGRGKPPKWIEGKDRSRFEIV